jgi:hypothetical protein
MYGVEETTCTEYNTGSGRGIEGSGLLVTDSIPECGPSAVSRSHALVGWLNFPVARIDYASPSPPPSPQSRVAAPDVLRQ